MVVAVLIGLGTIACEMAPRGAVGTWSAEVNDAEWWVQLEEDSTFHMTLNEMRIEGTYTTLEDDRIHLRPEGRMADVIPAGFRGTVDGDQMRLCNPAGRCVNLERW